MDPRESPTSRIQAPFTSGRTPRVQPIASRRKLALSGLASYFSSPPAPTDSAYRSLSSPVPFSARSADAVVASRVAKLIFEPSTIRVSFARVVVRVDFYDIFIETELEHSRYYRKALSFGSLEVD